MSSMMNDADLEAFADECMAASKKAYLAFVEDFKKRLPRPLSTSHEACLRDGWIEGSTWRGNFHAEAQALKDKYIARAKARTT